MYEIERDGSSESSRAGDDHGLLRLSFIVLTAVPTKQVSTRWRIASPSIPMFSWRTFAPCTFATLVFSSD